MIQEMEEKMKTIPERFKEAQIHCGMEIHTIKVCIELIELHDNIF
jgi:hypothetical protein